MPNKSRDVGPELVEIADRRGDADGFGRGRNERVDAPGEALSPPQAVEPNSALEARAVPWAVLQAATTSGAGTADDDDGDGKRESRTVPWAVPQAATTSGAGADDDDDGTLHTLLPAP